MKIEVYPVHENYGGAYMNTCVKLAKNNLPEWYKDSHSYFGNLEDKKFLEKRMTIKKCMPVLDYMSNGINLYLPFTIFVQGTFPERAVYVNTEHHTEHLCGLGKHSKEQLQKFPISDTYDPQPLKINFPYVIKTPKKYSSIFIQPANELSDILFFPRGLVNTDNYLNQVNLPFFIKKDFEGTIDAGSHFMSIFFIKREDIDMSYMDYEDGKNMISEARSMVANWGKHFYKNSRFN